MNQHTRLDTTPIPFIDVAAQRRRLGTAIDDAVNARAQSLPVSDGAGGSRFRSQSSRPSAAPRYALSCASGTDALVLTLMAKEIGPGDAVFCPSFTFCATAEAAALVGATPVFVDVHAESFNIDAAEPEEGDRDREEAGPEAESRHSGRSVRAAGRSRCHRGCRARRRICSCSTTPRRASARTYKGRKLGTFGHATATSFFPAKPLGCYGDGGAVLTDDDELLAMPQEPARAWAGQGQIRQCPYRHDRAARHHPGRGADREAEDFPATRSSRAIGSRSVTTKRSPMSRPCRRCRTATPRSGRNTPSAGTGKARSARQVRSRPKASRPRSIIRCRCTGRSPIAISRRRRQALR